MYILLVDDSEADNYLHRRMLLKRFAGCSVTCATSGEEGLALLKSGAGPIDLVLLDINMPQMDGWEFLRHYGELEPTRRARCLGLMESVTLPGALRRQAENSPYVDHVLRKPLAPEEIAELCPLPRP